MNEFQYSKEDFIPSNEHFQELLASHICPELIDFKDQLAKDAKDIFELSRFERVGFFVKNLKESLASNFGHERFF